MAKRYITTNAFPEPNYTQTPNDFFDMLPEMESSEVRVTLVMIRQTFGFHRSGFKMGIGKLAEAAGLSRNAAKDGAIAAEKRGTFRRANPDEQTEAEWELVVTECLSDSQPVTPTQSTSDSQVGIKESIKETKIGSYEPTSIEQAIFMDRPVTEPMLDQFLPKVKDAANLLNTGCIGGGALAEAFMMARQIVIPDSKIKGNRKAAREMLEMGVRPEHVTQAVKELTASGMTIVDLFSVSKTAIDLAHKSANAPKDRSFGL